MSPGAGRDTLSLRERAGVREPGSTLAMARMGRGMGSGVGAGAMLTGHEPGIPGGETPPATAGGTPAATDDRFMERNVFQNLDTYWAHEPWSEVGSERPSPRPSPGGRGRFCATRFGGVSGWLACALPGGWDGP